MEKINVTFVYHLAVVDFTLGALNAEIISVAAFFLKNNHQSASYQSQAFHQQWGKTKYA